MDNFNQRLPMSKNEKYWKRRFGSLADNVEPYYHHFDLRQIDDLDNEGFAYLIAPVKGIYMLDVNETASPVKVFNCLPGLSM